MAHLPGVAMLADYFWEGVDMCVSLISSVLCSTGGSLTPARAQDPQAHLSGPARPGGTGQRSAALRGSRCFSHLAGSAAGVAAVQAHRGEFRKIAQP